MEGRGRGRGPPGERLRAGAARDDARPVPERVRGRRLQRRLAQPRRRTPTCGRHPCRPRRGRDRARRTPRQRAARRARRDARASDRHRPWRPRPPRPHRHRQAGRQPGAGAAVPHRARQPPQGRPGPARAGLRHRRAVPPRADAQERRPLHHPPARGHHDPGRHRHDRADPGGGAAARHGRGHAVHPGGAAPRLRRRGRPARRRRHQARQGEVRRLRAGRDDPQDDRRDEQGHPGPGHQAGRPAAQHAHAALRQAGDPGAQVPRDARDLRTRWPTAWA